MARALGIALLILVGDLSVLVIAGLPDEFQWGGVAVFAILGLYCIALNWSIVRRGQGNSVIPLLGGCLCAVALLAAPAISVRYFAWLPLLADPGSIPLILLNIRQRRHQGKT